MFQDHYPHKAFKTRAEFIAAFVDDMTKVLVERFFCILSFLYSELRGRGHFCSLNSGLLDSVDQIYRSVKF